eukprot:3910130-Amphidinium_carterae.1
MGACDALFEKRKQHCLAESYCLCYTNAFCFLCLGQHTGLQGGSDSVSLKPDCFAVWSGSCEKPSDAGAVNALDIIAKKMPERRLCKTFAKQSSSPISPCRGICRR